MADAAGAITNGIEEADITIIVRGMCWFHCKKSIDKQIVKKISLSQWTEAYNWKKTAIIGQDLDTNKNKYYFKSGNSVEVITLEVIRKYDELMENCKWNNWAEFKNCAFGIWCVTMPDQLTDLNWKKGTCTCPTFYKKYLCKHIIGIALRLNSITKAALLMPLTAKDILISSKRKVGRPALAKRALLRQPLQSILQADEIDDEIEAIDDDIEYNEQQYSQIIEYQRMQQYIDNEYTLRFNNPMDCSMTNPFDYNDTNNDMFGLMRKTTSVSTADIINTISHISNIEESSESPTFTTLTSFNTLPSTSTTITTQETLSLTASNEERLLLKRKNKETDNLIPKKKPGRPLGSKNKQ